MPRLRLECQCGCGYVTYTVVTDCPVAVRHARLSPLQAIVALIRQGTNPV